MQQDREDTRALVNALSRVVTKTTVKRCGGHYVEKDIDGQHGVEIKMPPAYREAALRRIALDQQKLRATFGFIFLAWGKSRALPMYKSN